MKLSTINLIVETILEDTKPEGFAKTLANEATIYMKMALICESQGIEEAMKYFKGDHTMDEYKEFRTEVVKGGKYAKSN